MWCWIRKEKINWTDHVRNEEVLRSQGREEYKYPATEESRLPELVTSCIGTTF